MDDPSLNEPGCHSVLAIGPSFRKWPTPEDLASGNPQVREAYEAAKQEEGLHIIEYLNSYFPSFRENLISWEVGSPVTIERYTLKNGGAVSGPRQMMGQELLRRQHARTRWSNLFCCGESTTMGTGTPAVVISGLSAADVILRKGKLPEYRYCNNRGFVRYLRSPAPLYAADWPQSAGNLCLWCEHDNCRQACPWHMDIRGILRRLYSGNADGAQRLLFHAGGEGTAIPCSQCRDQPCLRACRRKQVLGTSVPIPEILLQLQKSGTDSQQPSL